MKIYYKQTSNPRTSFFAEFNIKDCYFKHLFSEKDVGKISIKEHHHNGFEIHIIKEGYQEYEADGRIYSVHSGEFFLCPPYTKHRVISASPDTEKFSITFSCAELLYIDKCVIGEIPQRFLENAAFIINESNNGKTTSAALIESSVCECVILFLRLSGLREDTGVSNEDVHDLRLDYVKKYIADNIDNWFTVSDIAAYGHISTRQLIRIFLKNEGITPAQYITKQRVEYIQMLLQSDELSLKEISETMHFQNEYYFNAFVKKHLGMPPGAYRRMNSED